MPFFSQGDYRAQAGDIDREAEAEVVLFRYSDLKPEAKERFTRLLKKDSSIASLRHRAKESDIAVVLEALDPILVRPGYQGGFSSSNIYRWHERMISSIVYNSLFRQRPRNASHWTLRNILATPRIAYVMASRHFICQDCHTSQPYSQMSHEENICDSCISRRRDLVRRIYTGQASQSEEWWDKNLCQRRKQTRE